jgi:hypothetical protein
MNKGTVEATNRKKKLLKLKKDSMKFSLYTPIFTFLIIQVKAQSPVVVFVCRVMWLQSISLC